MSDDSPAVRCIVAQSRDTIALDMFFFVHEHICAYLTRSFVNCPLNCVFCICHHTCSIDPNPRYYVVETLMYLSLLTAVSRCSQSWTVGRAKTSLGYYTKVELLKDMLNYFIWDKSKQTQRLSCHTINEMIFCHIVLSLPEKFLKTDVYFLLPVKDQRQVRICLAAV